MNRNTIGIRRFVWALVLTSILSLYPLVSWSAPEYREITILYTNDTHGHLLPFSYPDPSNDYHGDSHAPSVYKNIGGIARRATLIHRIETEVHGNAVVMDAGDVNDGTLLSVEYNGEADLSAMSAAGYEVMTPGNHDYGVSLDRFRQNLRAATFPIISANTVMKDSRTFLLPRYKIFKIDDIKIAVFGLTVPWNDTRICRDGVEILDPVSTAKAIVPLLRKEADVVVALTHLGLDEDPAYMKLAEVPGIDVIVDGHSHTRLPVPIFVRHADLPEAFRLGATAIVQDGQWGGELGRLDLILRRDGGPFTLTSVADRLIPVTSDIPDDPATEKVVEKYYRPIADKYDRIIGTASADFINSEGSENSLGNLVCDAMSEYAGVKIGIYNVGGVRGDIVKGPIRMFDLASVLPFQNTIVVLDISGKRLKEIMEKGLPYVAGIHYKVEEGKLVEASIDGKPIVDDAVYRVAAADYTADNLCKGATARKDLGENYRDALVRYIENRKVISPTTDGRRSVTTTTVH